MKLSTPDFSAPQSLAPFLAVVRRELLTTLRSGRTYLFLVSAMAIMTGLLSVYLSKEGHVGLLDARGMSRLAGTMFFVFAYGLYLAGMLLTPPIAASAICLEKQQERLDLLRMTHISRLALVFGKLVNTLGLYTLVAVAALPLAGVMMFFTGLDAQQYLQVLLLIFLSAASGTMIGLMFSAWFYRTVPSMILTYIAILFSQAGFAFLMLLWLRWGYAAMLELSGVSVLKPEWMETALVAFCPAYGIPWIASGSLGPSFYVIAPLLHGGILLACGWQARRLLDRPTAPMKVDTRKPIDDPALLEQRRKQFPFYLLDPQRRRKLIGDRQNPVYVKECYTGFANRGTTAVRMLYVLTTVAVVAGTFMIVFIESERRGMTLAWGFLYVETLLLAGMAPAFVATALSKEREWGNWDILRTTLLSPRQVVLGKLRAILRALALPGMALVLGSLPMLYIARAIVDTRYGMEFGGVMMIVTLLYTVSISLYVAAAQERSLPALLSAYGASFALLLILPIGATAWIELTDIFPGDPTGYRRGLWLSPLTMPPGLIFDNQDVWRQRLIPLSTWFVLSHVMLILLTSAGLVALAIYRCAKNWQGTPVTRDEIRALYGKPEPSL